jgi:hypothetical protein
VAETADPEASRAALIVRYVGVMKSPALDRHDPSAIEALFHATADIGLWNRDHPELRIGPGDTVISKG